MTTLLTHPLRPLSWPELEILELPYRQGPPFDWRMASHHNHRDIYIQTLLQVVLRWQEIWLIYLQTHVHRKKWRRYEALWSRQEEWGGVV
ncbi:hypothetical protein GQ44DRAFT_715529 [Phaeosphaeriaceae sp. PMI808]|nr:hypothetical protein GQ44DRAFT_715529 [Phaeosphaeriaceae sp. PMI808]